ncbi:BTB And Kelch [Ancylostoma duodenale]|uniref:BTB And Kelch n=1 Tax=Ancylostoma duodenale TaxID=51022 RepID=A0A0C2FDL7_9BILA|nr:BTB And Kelch [Ancylostoma duodenale]
MPQGLVVISRSAVVEVDRLIEKNFVLVSRSEAFLELSLDEVTELLSKDDLHVISEKDVFNAAIRWIEHSSERTKTLEKIISCVRLHLLDKDFLVNNVARHPIILRSKRCREMVRSKINFPDFMRLNVPRH